MKRIKFINSRDKSINLKKKLSNNSDPISNDNNNNPQHQHQDNDKDNDQNYKAMCDEFGQLILHSYTFDIESLGRKKEIFKKIKESIREDRINDLNSFDEFEEEIIDLSHFEFLNYIYKFVSDSLITHKRLLSVKIYNHLLGDTKIFDNKKKPVFKFECAT